MERIKVSENFYLDEFVNPDAYRKHGASSKGLLDARLIEIAEYIRAKSGKPVVINTWATGGVLKERGVRNPDSPTGAKMSRHKYFPQKKIVCRAIDVNIGKMSNKEMFEFVRKNEKELYSLGVRTVEDYRLTSNWLHLDIDERKHNFGEGIAVVDLSEVLGLISKIAI